MRVNSYGFVTVLEIIGNWQEKLDRLVGYNKPAPKVTKAITKFILEHPLGPKTEQDGYKEFYYGNLGNDWMLFYTNHHWFPVAWIIQQLPNPVLLSVADEAVLTRKTLGNFYANGLEHYENGVVVAGESVSAESFSGVLPTNYKAIESPLPDKLLDRFYPDR